MWNKLRLIILEFYYLVYDVCIMDVLEASSNALFYLQMRFFFNEKLDVKSLEMFLFFLVKFNKK